MSVRPAGLLESFHIHRHHLGFHSCVVLSARYTCPDETILAKEQLFPALRKVIETHPALGVKLENEDSKPTFDKLETIELPRVVRFSNNDNLEAAIQAQLARPFDTLAPLPLWRVEVLSDGTVLLAIHHGIADGLNGVAFHQCLLAALQQDVLVGDDSPVVPVPQSSVLLPPIESLTRLWPSLRRIFTEAFYVLAPASWTPGHFAWTANPVPQMPELKPHVKIISFSAAEMTAFAAACRSHGATVTSASPQERGQGPFETHPYSHLIPEVMSTAESHQPPLEDFEHIDPGHRALKHPHPCSYLVLNASFILRQRLGPKSMGVSLTKLNSESR